MLKLYGSARSRAARCLWMLEEIGQPYEHIDLAGMDQDATLKTVTLINPIGKVPALEDGEIKRWRESCYDRPSYRKIYPG